MLGALFDVGVPPEAPHLGTEHRPTLFKASQLGRKGWLAGRQQVAPVEFDTCGA